MVVLIGAEISLSETEVKPLLNIWYLTQASDHTAIFTLYIKTNINIYVYLA